MRASISVLRRLSVTLGLAAIVAASLPVPGPAGEAADPESTVTATPAVATGDSASASEEALLQLVTDAEAAVAAGVSAPHTESLLAALERLRQALESRALSMAEPRDADDADDVGPASLELGDAVEQAFGEADEPASDAGADGLGAGGRGSALGRASALAGEAVRLVEALRDLRDAFGSFGRSSAGPSVDADGEAGERSDVDTEEGSAGADGRGTDEDDPGSEEAPFGEVTGLVTERGEPVVGAEVVDEDTGERSTTDANGRYRLRALSSATALRVAIQPPGRGTTRGRLALGPGRDRLADLELGRGGIAGQPSPLLRVLGSRAVDRAGSARGATVSGAVEEADGRPAVRRLIGLDSRTWVRTDAAGRYRFYRVAPGSHTLTATPETGPRVDVRVQVSAGTATAPTIRLARARRMDVAAGGRRRGGALGLGGRVVDAAGTGLARASIVLLSGPDRAARSTRTHPGGGFRLRGLDAGRYRLVVQCPGFETASHDVLLSRAGPRDVRVVLRSANRPIPRRRPAPPVVRAREQTAGASARREVAPPPPARAARVRPAPPAERAPDAPPPPAVSASRARTRTPAAESSRVGDLVVVVQDSRGRRMEGAVSVERSGVVVARESTRGGTCAIRGVPAGSCRIAVSGLGGHVASRTVNVRASNTTNVRLVVQR